MSSAISIKRIRCNFFFFDFHYTICWYSHEILHNVESIVKSGSEKKSGQFSVNFVKIIYSNKI